jgi:hypothetical protein
MLLTLDVVEDHHHALQCIHRHMRRKRLPLSGLTMLHVDAHPDLLVPPNVKLGDVWHPQELYCALEESVGGIAEWILPLCLEGHLDSVTWLRSPWSDQFPDGLHSVEVGGLQGSGSLRVKNTAPYYLDDPWLCVDPLAGEVLSEEEARTLQLRVSDINTDGTACGEQLRPPWILDLCLDYFSTANPFLSRLEEAMTVDAEGLRTLRDVFRLPLHRSGRAGETAGCVHVARRFDEVLKRTVLNMGGENVAANLAEFYPQDSGRLLEDFGALLRPLSISERKEIVYMGHCVLLPHHPSTRLEMEAMVLHLENFLAKQSTPPLTITMARSERDGFTPDALWIEDRVICMLQGLYGGKGDGRNMLLQVIRHEEQD